MEVPNEYLKVMDNFNVNYRLSEMINVQRDAFDIF